MRLFLFPRFFSRSPLPLAAANSSVARSLFLSAEREFTELARRDAAHALTLRTHDLASRITPLLALCSVAGGHGSAYRESRTKSPIPRSSSAAATRAFYAAIGALRWPSLECARPHRPKLIARALRTLSPSSTSYVRPSGAAPFADDGRVGGGGDDEFSRQAYEIRFRFDGDVP